MKSFTITETRNTGNTGTVGGTPDVLSNHFTEDQIKYLHNFDFHFLYLRFVCLKN